MSAAKSWCLHLPRRRVQVRLRYHVYPEDLNALIATDYKAFTYFLSQSVSDFRHSRQSVDITPQETLAVVCLLMRHYSLGSHRLLEAGTLAQDIIRLEKDVGFTRFCPERIKSDFPDALGFKKSLVFAMRQFFELDDQQECEGRLLQLLSGFDPNFGLHSYPLVIKHGESAPGTVTVSSTDCTVYGSDGYTVVTSVSLAAIKDCQVVKSGAKPGASRNVPTTIMLLSKELSVINFPNEENAIHFAMSCELYRALLYHQAHPSSLQTQPPVFWNVLPVAQTPPPKLPRKPSTPSGSPVLPPRRVVTKDSTSQSPKLPPKAPKAPSTPSRQPSVRRPPPKLPNHRTPPPTPISPEPVSKPPRPAKPRPRPRSAESLQIDSQSLTFEDILGDGAFGVVRKAVLQRPGEDDTECAVKQLKLDDSDESEADLKVEFMAEARLMTTLQHPNIVKLYGISEELGMPLIVMELMPLGELRTFIRNKHATLHLCRALFAKYILQVARAIKYLHSLSIIHRDLAARNILVRDPATVKVADFGLSRRVIDGVYDCKDEDMKMPLKWMAPESVLDQCFTMQTDMWMYGVCSWEIFSTGLKPFLAVKNAHYLRELKKGTRLKQPKGCPVAIYKKLRQCWEYDPKKRCRAFVLIRNALFG